MSHQIKPMIYVEIKGDYDLVSAFLYWQIEERVFSMRGYGFSGQGGYGGFFDHKDKKAIEKFFAGKTP